MKLSEAKIDVAKQEEGGWVDKIPEMEGLRLKVRGAENKDWKRLRARLFDAVPRKKRMAGRLDPEEQDRITSMLLRDTCLLDWDGLEDEGRPLPYSKDKANELLTNPEYAKFRDAVLWAANVVAEQQDAEVKQDLGN